MTSSRLRVLFAVLLLATAAMAAGSDWYYSDIDSARGLPTDKLFYLEQKAGRCPTPLDEPESLNVRLVGKWGAGPSWAVTGRDSLVYLSRGSEVVVINFADTANPQILNYIQAKRLAARPVLQDSFLYLATSGWIEVFNVSDPTNAPRIGRLATPVSDIDVEGHLVYAIAADSFKVFDFTNPANPTLVGACRDSAYALDYDNGYAYLCDRWGLYVIDATNPANPHRVASWGTDIAAVKVRGNHCYVTQGSMGSNSLHVLNVANPAAPWQEGVLSATTGEDIYLVDTLLFLPGFDVVSIADSSRPRLVGHTVLGGYSVWADGSVRMGFVATNYTGLRVLNLASIANPVLDTTMLPMGDAVGISVSGGIACVAAQDGTGLTLLDVSDPSHPTELANLDTAGGAPWSGAVINCESLAYIGWGAGASPQLLRVVDISDPTAPHFVGGASGFNPITALALRDTLIFAAEDYKFEVFSVANPRQPVWLGSCNLGTSVGGLCLRDTLAYVSPDIQIINIARPNQPTLISSTACNAWNMAIRDTFGYVAHARESLKVYSVTNPGAPYRLSSTWVPGQAYDIALSDTCALLGCDDFRVFDLTSPAAPQLVGRYTTPYRARSIDFAGPYIYTACYLAGVCVLEQLPSGIAEERPTETRTAVGMRGSVVRDELVFELPAAGGGDVMLSAYDVSGRCVEARVLRGQGQEVRYSFARLPAGVYVLRVRCEDQVHSFRIVKL